MQYLNLFYFDLWSLRRFKNKQAFPLFNWGPFTVLSNFVILYLFYWTTFRLFSICCFQFLNFWDKLKTSYEQVQFSVFLIIHIDPSDISVWYVELLNRKSLHSSLHTITDSLTLTLTFLCVTSGYDMSNDKQQMCGHSIENVHEMSWYSYTIFYDFISRIKGQVNLRLEWKTKCTTFDDCRKAGNLLEGKTWGLWQQDGFVYSCHDLLEIEMCNKNPKTTLT